MQLLLVTLASLFLLISPATYIVSILRGVTKPARMTRLIIFLVTLLNFFATAQVKGNTGAYVFALLIFAQAVAIFVLSIFKGVGGASRLDWVCLAIALLGILGWKFSGSVLVGLCFSVMADFVAYIPAFVKTWKYPKTEEPLFYATSSVSAILSLMAYQLDISSIFQIYIILGNFIMFACIYHKEWRKIFLRK